MTGLQPWGPAAFAGSLKIIDADKVELVDSNIGEYSKILSHWGVGLPKVLRKNPSEMGTRLTLSNQYCYGLLTGNQLDMPCAATYIFP